MAEPQPWHSGLWHCVPLREVISQRVPLSAPAFAVSRFSAGFTAACFGLLLQSKPGLIIDAVILWIPSLTAVNGQHVSNEHCEQDQFN